MWSFDHKGGMMAAGAVASFLPTKPQQHITWPGFCSIPVRSLSQPVWDSLQGGGRVRVLARFRRVINLLLDDDKLLALALPDVGNGPFHIVLSHLPQTVFSDTVPLRWEITTSSYLHIGPWILDCGPTPNVWQPSPPWETLSPNPARLVELRRAMLQAAWRHPAPSPIVRHGLGEPLPAIVAFERALAAANLDALPAATCSLAGLGPGLTPSGDDFLAGAMLGLWFTHASLAKALCPVIVAAAAPRTTRLSRAFLHAASQGHADEHWHHLLRALCGTDTVALHHAAQTVIAFGANSGLDMLTGFLSQALF